MTALPQTVKVAQLLSGVDPDVAEQAVSVVRDLEQEKNQLALDLKAVRLGRNLVLDANEALVMQNEALVAQAGEAA